jgi:hypothetical protein
VKHRATPRFWKDYAALPRQVQQAADAAFKQLKRDTRHPALQLKKIDRFWSVRIGLHYRALAVESGPDLLWFWIGSHAEYDTLIRGS